MDAIRYHSLLADVHRLLGSYSSKEFLEASEQSIDCHVLLRSLATSPSKEASTEPEKIARALPDNEPAIEEVQASHSFSKTPEEIENILRRSGKAETNSDINAICRAFNINVSLSPKDARARNLTKLSKAIAFSPAKLRNHVVKELTRKTNSETQGWLDVIRGRK